MHQTVREFFLDPNGLVGKSKFGLCERDAHISISVTCVRYLMLCTKITALAENPQDMTCWTPEHFACYAELLDRRPLANYTICHLKYHIDGCRGDENVRNIVSYFISDLKHSPAAYLLSSWVYLCFGTNLLPNEKATAAQDFRNKVLQSAVRNKLLTAVGISLMAGANINQSHNGDGLNPLQWATKNGHEAIVKLLLEAKAEVESKDSTHSQTPLLWAAKNGHDAVVKLLLEAKADVESRGSHSQTPLSWAAKNGHDAIVKLLLEAKADVESKDSHSQTPLSWAAKNGHDAVVKLLLEAKADVESKDCHNQTPLWAAVKRRRGRQGWQGQVAQDVEMALAVAKRIKREKEEERRRAREERARAAGAVGPGGLESGDLQSIRRTNGPGGRTPRQERNFTW
jgi:ankyrin repeat domain-containing protein 50